MTAPTPRLTVSPAHSALAEKSPTALDLVIRLAVPPLPQAPSRPSMNLALVIDTSGSMAGQPLEEAKKAAQHLVQTLQSGDRVCVVAYESTAHLVAEPTDAVAGRALLLAAIASLRASGSTALRAGWLAGAHAVAPFVSQHGLTRVLLLSDGCATDGSAPEQLYAEAAELASAGIGTSTYGLGQGFNENLMTRLAQGGGGQAFYALNAEALVPYFESEFQMLASTVGKQVQVAISAKVGTRALKISRLDTLAEVAGPVAIGSLVAGADSWIAFRVDVPALASAKDVVVEATATWADLAGAPQSETCIRTVGIRAKARKNQDAWAMERIKEVEASRLQREALEKARRGDWAGADNLLRSAGQMAMGNAYVGSVSESLAGMVANRDLSSFSKEVAYASHTMSSRVVDANEDVATLDAGRFGLRKAMQGHAAPPAQKKE